LETAFDCSNRISMFIWIAITLLTTGLAVILLRPILDAGGSGADHGHDVEVYKDQLAEVARDEQQGLISETEAAYARAEIGRRLLAASDRAAGQESAPEMTQAMPKAGRSPSVWVASAVIILVLPLVGIGLYRNIGQPDLPDLPLAARMEQIASDEPLLLATVENRLMKTPDDGKGWDLLAPIYYRLGRHEDAKNAFDNAIRLLGPSAERLSGLGETLVDLSAGTITDEAKKAFRDALTLEPNHPRARFYVALALEKEGRKSEALAGLVDLVRVSPKDAPWLDFINRHIDRLQKPDSAKADAMAPGNPTAADVEAAQSMEAGDRDQMIRSMVAGLDEKLKANPDNFDGWMRLVRSYAMLKEPAKAQDALARGLAAFPQDSEKGKALLAAAKDLGVTGPEAKP
jgi:cytochrome c-type biogenesis protein CcmH